MIDHRSFSSSGHFFTVQSIASLFVSKKKEIDTMIRSILALFALAFLGLTAAWTSNGYYDRYNVAPMRADQVSS
jgi:hypothetical protein